MTGIIVSVGVGFAGCSSTPKLEKRAPASFCRPTPEDEKTARKIIAHKDSWEKKRKARIRAQVQGYVLGEELVHEFDQELDKGTNPEELLKSKLYKKLQALHEVRRYLRHSLEDIYMIKINDQLAAENAQNDPTKRKEIIVGYVREVRDAMESMLKKYQGNYFVAMALLEVQEGFEDLEKYYVNCDYKIFSDGLDERIKRREELSEKLLNAYGSQRPESGFYKNFGPSKDEDGITGTDVERLISRMANRREPQSVWTPDPGKKGNIMGGEFPTGKWALTFDDGPGLTTPTVLDNLKETGMKGTFFVLSQGLDKQSLLQHSLRAIDEGHAMASHSYTHAQIPKLDQKHREHEINDAVKVFETKLGQKSTYFRFPYGAGLNVASLRQMLADGGMIHVFWNVDTLDWQDKNPQTIFDRALKQMNQLKRGIILFHDIHPQSVVASKMIMKYLTDPANHLTPVTIPQIVEQMKPH